MLGPDRVPLTGTRLALFLELPLWVPLVGEEGARVPVALVGAQDGTRREQLAFSAVELALAVELDHSDVRRSTVWTELQALPDGTGLTIDIGQVDEVVVPAEEVDALLGGPRRELPALSPAQRAALAYAWLLVTSVGKKIVVLDRGPERPPRVPAWTDPRRAKAARPPRGRVRQVGCTDLLRRLPGSYEVGIDLDQPTGVLLDPATRPAVLAAHELFPPGHLAELQPGTPGLEALAAAAREAVDPAPDACLLGYRTHGAPGVHLLVVDLPPGSPEVGAVEAAVTAACAELQPAGEVRLACLDDLPAAAADAVRRVLVGARGVAR